MSKKNDASLESTKQMLDELDALMEKMLALPVTGVDESPAPVKVVAKLPPMSAKLTLLPPATEPAPSAVPPQVEHPPLNPPHLAMPAAPPMPPAAAPQPAPLTNDVLPASVMAKLEPLLAALSEQDAPAAPYHDGFLWRLNQAFDGATFVLGGLGRWLRAPSGRMVLGVAGVVMLLAAAGWFLRDWLGWHWETPFIR